MSNLSRTSTPKPTDPAPTDLTPKDEARQRLIALNTAPDLPRSSICSLAAQIDRWLEPETAGVSSRQLGVPADHLRRARAAVGAARTTAGKELERAAAAGVRILTQLDSEYPSRLRDLALAPPVLYIDGTLPDRPSIAIVGSRRADSYGLEVALRFGEALAEAGVCVVSGYARGIDSAAHQGALRAAGGETVAVLGCGVDVEYPRTHRELGRKVREHGALVSEFPLGCEPRGHHFPIRNRIIAALSSGTLVVRAAARSGSLITARLALELGRDVYAVPGNLFEPLSIGPNCLIRDGAFLIQHPRDLIETLPLEERPAPDEAHTDPTLPPRTGLDGRILQALTERGRQTPDALAQHLELSVDRLLAHLLDLELGGYVDRLPGPMFVRRD